MFECFLGHRLSIFSLGFVELFENKMNKSCVHLQQYSLVITFLYFVNRPSILPCFPVVQCVCVWVCGRLTLYQLLTPYLINIDDQKNKQADSKTFCPLLSLLHSFSSHRVCLFSNIGSFIYIYI